MKLTNEDIKFLTHLVNGPKTLAQINVEWEGFGRSYNSCPMVRAGLIDRKHIGIKNGSYLYTITFKGQILLATQHERID
jgi:predicted transcriptional regulator